MKIYNSFLLRVLIKVIVIDLKWVVISFGVTFLFHPLKHVFPGCCEFLETYFKTTN